MFPGLMSVISVVHVRVWTLHSQSKLKNQENRNEYELAQLGCAYEKKIDEQPRHCCIDK